MSHPFFIRFYSKKNNCNWLIINDIKIGIAIANERIKQNSCS